MSAAKFNYNLFLGMLEEHFDRSRYAPDAIVLFHWPGNAALGPAIEKYSHYSLDFAAYPTDIDHARQSAERLAQYLMQLPRPYDPGAFTVTLVGHSLGCRLILEMLNRLRELSPDILAGVDVLSLMAPAVPTDLVAQGGNLRLAVKGCRRVLKCFSNRDWVLRIGFPLAQRVAYYRNKESNLYREAMGRFGNPIDVGLPLETTNGHGDYWGDEDLTSQLSRAIDPTYYRLSPPRKLRGRRLAEPAELGWRVLGLRVHTIA